jgi:hypothetical protein
MPDTLMNLVATADVKNATGPIRELQKTLEGASKTGVQDLSGWQKSASILNDVFYNLGVTGARSFGIVGTAAGAAGGALLVLNKLLLDFSKQEVQEKYLSLRTHVPVEAIEQLRQTGVAIGVEQGTINTGLKNYAETIENINQNTTKAAKLHADLTAHGREDIFGKLQNLSHLKDRTKIIQETGRIFEGLDPQMRPVLAKILGISDEMGEVLAEAERVNKVMPKAFVPEDFGVLRQFKESVDGIGESFKEVKDRAYDQMVPAFAAVTGAVSKFLIVNQKPIDDAIVRFFAGIRTEAGNFVKDMGTLSGELAAIEQQLEDWGLVSKKLAPPGTPERAKQDEEEKKAGGMFGLAGPLHRALQPILPQGGAPPGSETEQQLKDAAASEYKPPATPAPNIFDRVTGAVSDYNARQLEAERAAGIQPQAPPPPTVPATTPLVQKPAGTEAQPQAQAEPSLLNQARAAAARAAEGIAAYNARQLELEKAAGFRPEAPSLPVVPEAAAPPPPPSPPQPEAVAPEPGLLEGAKEKGKEIWRGFWNLFHQTGLEVVGEQDQRAGIVPASYSPPTLQVAPAGPAPREGEQLPGGFTVKEPFTAERQQVPPAAAAPIIKASLELPREVSERLAGLQKVNGVPPMIKLPTPDARDRPTPAEPERGPGAPPSERKGEPQEQRADLMAWLRQQSTISDETKQVPGFQSELSAPEARNISNKLDDNLGQDGARGRIDSAIAPQTQAQKVEGTGHIRVDVNAPKGTIVSATGSGLFKEIEMSRSSQMSMADDWSD